MESLPKSCVVHEVEADEENTSTPRCTRGVIEGETARDKKDNGHGYGASDVERAATEAGEHCKTRYNK
jgi:hypothetical protein